MGAISSFAFRPRDRPRARTAGTVVFKGGEPAFCPHSDYSWVYNGVLDVHADGRYEGFAWSDMLEKAYPLVRPGGCPFFRRGGARGRAGAFKNHRKVCVLEGAPRGRAGAGGSKIIDFSLICPPPREYVGK